MLALLILSPLSSCSTLWYLFIIWWSCFILREARGSLLDIGGEGRGGGGDINGVMGGEARGICVWESLVGSRRVSFQTIRFPDWGCHM